MNGTSPYARTCQGCGGRLYPTDDVRALHRELADPPEGDEATFPIVAYSHLGHEPQLGYRITGRGLLGALTEGSAR
jgi:hypothetical protein